MNAREVSKGSTLNSCRISEFWPVLVVWVLPMVERALWITLQFCAVNKGWGGDDQHMDQRWYNHQAHSSEHVNSWMNIAYSVKCNPVWRDLPDEVWKAPQHRVKHWVLRGNDHARRDSPHDICDFLANFCPIKTLREFCGSFKHHVTFENESISPGVPSRSEILSKLRLRKRNWMAFAFVRWIALSSGRNALDP